MKSIQKTAPAKFKISTPGVSGSDLDLDFNPIINEFKLAGNFMLIHWQARPKGHRQWGIYESKTDTYRSVEKLKINLATSESLQLDDGTATTVPSAVFYTAEDKLNCINDKAIIGNISIADLA